ncbi:MAG: hypothetical protein V1747_02475 [Candidatus Omnitrophota bacterium]
MFKKSVLFFTIILIVLVQYTGFAHQNYTQNISSALSPQLQISSYPIRMLFGQSEIEQRNRLILEAFSLSENDGKPNQINDKLNLYILNKKSAISLLSIKIETLTKRNRDSADDVLLTELREQLEKAQITLRKDQNRSKKLLDLEKKYGLIKALKILGKVKSNKLNSQQQFAIDILKHDKQILPNGLFNTDSVMFLSEESWLRDLFEFKGAEGMTVYFQDKGNLQVIILIEDKLENEINILKVLLHELMHKELAIARFKVTHKLNINKCFYSVLNEVEVERKSAELLSVFAQKNAKVAKALINYYKQGLSPRLDEVKTAKQIQKNIALIGFSAGASYLDYQDLIDQIDKTFGPEAQEALNHFLYTGDEQKPISVFGQKTWNVFVNSFEIALGSKNKYVLPSAICYLLAETLRLHNKDAVDEKLYTVYKMIEIAVSLNKEMYVRARGNKYPLETFQFFLKAKLNAMNKIFRDWTQNKTTMGEMEFVEYFERELSVIARRMPDQDFEKFGIPPQSFSNNQPIMQAL